MGCRWADVDGVDVSCRQGASGRQPPRLVQRPPFSAARLASLASPASLAPVLRSLPTSKLLLQHGNQVVRGPKVDLGNGLDDVAGRDGAAGAVERLVVCGRGWASVLLLVDVRVGDGWKWRGD
jgi:hypothetical protein